MLFKKSFAALLLITAMGFATASNEWNDTLLGWVYASPQGVILAYNVPCPTLLKNKSAHAARLYTPKGVISGCWGALNDKAVFKWDDGTYSWYYQFKFNRLRGT